VIIAVNTRLLLHDRLEGIGRFADETLRNITREHPEHKFIFIFDRDFSSEFIYSDNIIPLKGFPQTRHPFLWYMFFEKHVPAVLEKYKADIFLSPDGWLSLKTSVKSLPVMHDINFFHFPGFIPLQVRSYYNYFIPRFVRKASRIATVSEFSKKDISDYFHYDTAKIDVVHNAASDRFSPISTEEQFAVRQKFTGGCPYFLFTGLIHPRKNIAGLIRAFDGFKASSGSNVKLFLAGSLKWKNSDVRSAFSGSPYKADIIFAGRIPDADLRKITASALAMVYVSFFEGFGLPVIEAMNCDVPVIASETSSLPEVGGDAVYYVDPYSTESIKNAMLALYKDDKFRNDLIIRGRVNRQRFSWKKTADLLWQSINKVGMID